jgi:hypothetical protein
MIRRVVRWCRQRLADLLHRLRHRRTQTDLDLETWRTELLSQQECRGDGISADDLREALEPIPRRLECSPRRKE